MMTDIDTVYVRTAGFASIGVLSFHEIQKAEQFYPKALTNPFYIIRGLLLKEH